MFMNPVDKGGMPEEWKEFYVNPIEVTSATAPSNYGSVLSENVRSGVQNNTRLKLISTPKDSVIQISSTVTGYSTSPVAIQQGDVATENRLSITVNFVITSPTKGLEEMTFSTTRFANYDASQQLVDVEQSLIENINQQIVQDVINKLNSNW
jgi:outer membrane lipopolysaccharide assembly protein LptE/RlpB